MALSGRQCLLRSAMCVAEFFMLRKCRKYSGLVAPLLLAEANEVIE
jgi:hypothetical protein